MPSRSASLPPATDMRAFVEFADRLLMSEDERRRILDMSAQAWTELNSGRAAPAGLAQHQQRRLAYALSLMRRQAEAMAPLS